MANYSERAAAAGYWRPDSARHRNATITLAEKYMQQELGEPKDRRLTARRTDTSLVKNSSNADLVRGQVLQLSGLLNYEEPDAETLCFDGVEPDPDGSDSIAVLLDDAKDDDIVEAQLSGIVFCRLNIVHLQHKRADVDAGETVLQSHWHGRCEILWKETDATTPATGEQDAIVRIGEMYRGPINAVISESGGIAVAGSGDVSIYWAGAGASPSSTETAWLNWMTSSTAAAETSECQIWWHPDQQKYVIGNLEC